MTEPRKSKAEKFGLLRQKFRQQLPQRLADIQQGWDELLISDNNHIILESTFYRHLHSLAGAAGTFGYKALGQQARSLEDRVHGAVLNDLDKNIINKDLLKLESFINKTPDAAGQNVAENSVILENDKPEQSSLVYILEDDELLANEISNQIYHFGYKARSFDNPAALRAGFRVQTPKVLICDVHFPEGDLAGPQVTKLIQDNLSQTVPVIYISSRDDWQARLAAVQAGGQAYLNKPLDFHVLVEQLDRLSGHKQEAPYNILIIDDTQILAEHYAMVLEDAGMNTMVQNDASQLLEILPDFLPDLIVMDIYMPDCLGTHAAQVIRQHPSYHNIPIVFLSAETALQEQLSAMRLGGDDFLQKPISDQHLTAAVKIRAKRFRKLNELMMRDGLTGLLNHINYKLVLQQTFAQAQRQNREFCIAILDIDHFKTVNDSYGHPMGDRVIKSLSRLLTQRLRKSDIAARYGGEEFALILPDTDIVSGKELLDKLCQQFSKINFDYNNNVFKVSFSAGIAVYNSELDMDSLIQLADEMLYKAKNNGRNQVVGNESIALEQEA